MCVANLSEIDRQSEGNRVMPSAFFDSQNKKKADDLQKKETRTNVKKYRTT